MEQGDLIKGGDLEGHEVASPTLQVKTVRSAPLGNLEASLNWDQQKYEARLG